MADALTPMAELAGRWGVTPNTVSRRLSFLGIKPIRQGNFRFLDPEQLELAEQLQQHILSGRPMESFPRPEQDGEGGQVVRQVRQPAHVAGQVEQVAALAAALAQVLPPPPADPLARARGLAEAADNGLVFENSELRALGVRGVAGSTDAVVDAHGYRFRRHQPGGPGSTVYWTVERVLGQPAASRTTSAGASPTTSRPVGFLGAPEARSVVTVQAISLPAF